MLKNSLSIDLYARIYAQFMIYTLSLSLLRIQFWNCKAVDVVSITYLNFRAKNIKRQKIPPVLSLILRENSSMKNIRFHIFGAKIHVWKILDFIFLARNFKCTLVELVEFYFANQIPFPLLKCISI